MIPAPFEYYAPKTLEEVLQLLAQYPEEAKVLAGGQSLVPMMKMRLATPSKVIDLNRVAELSYIREEGQKIGIGAMTRHYEIETSSLIHQRCPLLAECAREIGDVQVRNRGTIGGSLAHSDPSADYPAVMLACEAEIKLRSQKGERVVKAEDFFVDLFTTALEPGELLVEVQVPVCPPHTGTAYLKMEQRASGFALCGVAVWVQKEGELLKDLRVGITGVGPKAYRARETENLLRGRRPEEDLLHQAVGRVVEGVMPLEDIHASADYRVHLAQVLTRRAIRQALERI